MNRYLTFLALLIALVFSGMGAAALQDSSQTQKAQKTTSSNSNSHTAPVTGEEVFEANCARCHTPPMSIPQRVTGTIIMHMRARARLSRQDEQLLLKYMAP